MLKTTLTTIIGAFVIHTGALAQIYVKSNGVGIGINTPTEKLHVAGKTLIESNDGNMLNFLSSNTAAWQFLAFNKGGSRIAWAGINGGYDFNIKTEAAPGHILLTPLEHKTSK